MPQWPVPADHAILVGGLPLFHEYEATGDIYPGMVVAHSGAVNPVTISPCDSGTASIDDPVGVAVLSMADQHGHGSFRDPNCTGAATSNDLPYHISHQVKVVSGPVFVMLILDENQHIVPGDKVMCSDANPGYVVEFFCGLTTSDPCALVAESLEHVVNAAGTCEYFLAKLLI